MLELQQFWCHPETTIISAISTIKIYTKSTV